MDNELLDRLMAAIVSCYTDNLSHKDLDQLVREYESWVGDDDELLLECKTAMALDKLLE